MVKLSVPSPGKWILGILGKNMFSYFLGSDHDDDDATLRRDKSEITWPLSHRTQGPNTS